MLFQRNALVWLRCDIIMYTRQLEPGAQRGFVLACYIGIAAIGKAVFVFYILGIIILLIFGANMYY